MRLVIFDVDGTLVDSQHMIWAAMQAAYVACDLPAPARQVALSHVGRSLDLIFPDLSPELDTAQHRALAEGYRAAYHQMRDTQGAAQSSPLFPGARAALDRLQAQPETSLAVATGKALRGLEAVIGGHSLTGMFISKQTADHHPSKPHPSMVLACLADAGLGADRAVMVGDTTFDMDMARDAGVATIGVSWGFHPAEALKADRMIDDFAQLDRAIDDLIGG